MLDCYGAINCRARLDTIPFYPTCFGAERNGAPNKQKLALARLKKFLIPFRNYTVGDVVTPSATMGIPLNVWKPENDKQDCTNIVPCGVVFYHKQNFTMGKSS